MISKSKPNSEKTYFRAINFPLAGIFTLFAWLQRNDIDPAIYSNPSFDNPTLDSALWFLFYLMIAVGFILVSYRKLPIWYFVVALVVCLFEMTMSGPGLWNNLFGKESFNMAQTSMTAEDPRVELTREFFGALLALFALVFQFWQTKRFYQ